MKRFLVCMIVAVALLVLVCAVAVAAETEGTYRGVKWKYENGVLYISASGEFWFGGPWDEYSKKVKTLEFSGENVNIKGINYEYKNVTTIRIGKGVLSADESVFKYIGKKVQLIIDENNYILDCISYDPSKITDVVLGPDVDNYTLSDGFILNSDGTQVIMCFGKKKEKIEIPDGIKEIKSRALAGNSMKELYLPDGLETIGDWAFSSCKNLKRITIPSSVKTIGNAVFSGCTSLTSINFLNLNVKHNRYDIIDYYDGMNSLKALVIPNFGDISEVSIGENKSLSTIIISEGNTKFDGNNGSLLDLNNKKLKALYLPQSIENISWIKLGVYKYASLYVIEGSYAHQFAMEYEIPYYIVTPIDSISLSDEDIVLKKGKQVTIKATILPEDSTSRDNQWMSTNEKIATVQDGRIKAVDVGECDVICRGLDCGGITAVCHVTVTE